MLTQGKVNKMNLIKKVTMGVIATSLSITANATFMTVAGNGSFTSAVDSGGAAIAPVDAGLTSTIGWGTPTPSYLELVDEAQQNVDVLGQNYLLSTLTHNNVEIAGATLTSATIGGVLTLDGDFPFPSPFDINTAFNINFEETGNGDCNALGKDNGETGVGDPNQHVHGSVCDDRFDYTVNGGSFPLVIPMIISGFAYDITIFASEDVNGSTLLASNRFWTQENQQTSIYTFLRLERTVPVPEPTSLAILGLGLLGLASAKKRKA